METTRFRAARESDYGAIAEGLQQWWTMPGFDRPTAARERAALVPRLWLQHFASTSLIALGGPKLIGFLIGFLSPDWPEEGYIHFVGVAPGARRQGVGRALYERFFDACRIAGRLRVRCVTSPTNTLSIAFHSGVGFEIDPGTEAVGSVLAKADYDGPGVHRVAFVRVL